MLSKGQEYRRGWPVLIASAVGSGVGLAPVAAYSLGALVSPLADAFGWSRGEIGAAALFQSFGALAAGSVAGALADRFGARPVALVSQVTLTLALAGLSLVSHQVVTLYVGYFLLAILGAGTLPMIWGRAIVGWFHASRGVALGISLFGTGIVGATLPSYVSWLAGAYGWKGAYLGLAALPLVLGLPIALLAFREPGKQEAAQSGAAAIAEAREGHTFRQAVGTLCFWQMSIAFIVVAVAISGVLVHALPMLRDRGVAPQTAAVLAGLFGLAVIVGRLISGYFLDIFKGPIVGAAMFALAAGAAGVLMVSGSNLILCGGAIICVGLSAGAESDVAAYLVAKYFGRLNYGAIYGLVYTLFGLGGGFGPMIVGAVYDKTGSYDVAMGFAVGIFLLCALVIGTVRAPHPPEPMAHPLDRFQ